MQVSRDNMEPLLIRHAISVAECENENGADVTCNWIFDFNVSRSGGDSDNTWGVGVFERLLHTFHSDPSYTETITAEQLTVSLGSAQEVQLHIHGVSNITMYCLNETPKLITQHEWMRVNTILSEQLPDELPLAVTSKVVTSRRVTNYEPIDWELSMKHYKLTKEFVYEKEDTLYKLVIIRNGVESTKMTTSGVSTNAMTYAFHVVTKIRDIKHINYVLNACMPMMQMLTQTKYPLSKAQQIRIAEEYDALVKQVLDVPRWKKFENKDGGGPSSFHFLAPKPVTLESMHLVEPGPETYGVQSVLKGYAVTDKADGERMLMYISKTGDAYLINNVFEVFGTGLNTSNKELFESILDGEFIPSSLMLQATSTSSCMQNQSDIFAVFDAYFINGKSVMALPLFPLTPTSSSVKANGGATSSSIQQSKGTRNSATPYKSRVDVMKQICDESASRWNSQHALVSLKRKEHVGADGKSMFDACKAILQNARQLPYSIDGLIFTPRDLSVFGYYPGVPVPIPDNVRWDKVMKWKPSDQNSIDFLVDEVDDGYRIDPVTQKHYRQFKLYTGYNSAQWEPITPFEGIQLRYDRAYASEKRNMRRHYRAKEFRPFSNYEQGVEIAEVEVNPVSGLCECQDASIVTKNTIVEFAYDVSQSSSQTNNTILNASRRWIPMRVRDDKTRILQNALNSRHFPPNLPSKTANDLNVAVSIWRTIHDPVTRDHITGVTPIGISAVPDTLEEKLLGVDDVYYARDVPRQHLLSVHMLDFHNQGIKKMLYEKSDKRDSLLELACGMAGDLPRWRDGNFKFVLGVDLSRDNITNPRNGAYARMLNQRQALNNAHHLKHDGLQRPHYMDAVFIVGDCGKSLQTGEAVGEDKESQQILQILYNKSRGQTNIPYNVTKHIAGRAAQGFSMASCMFAVHYFFQSEAKLNGFLQNVATSLRKGGLFIVTFMDGERVHSLLTTPQASSSQTSSQTKEGVIEGRKLNGSVPVWAIIKRYASFDRDDCWGKHVDVFLENTNKLIPEFVVHFDKLVEKASAYGLALESDGMFSDRFKEILAGASANTGRPNHLDAAVLALNKDPVQTQFSFLNRWAIFKKIT